MSVRGIASGVTGSAAVAVVAALSLGMTHASASTETAPAAHASVTPAAHAIAPHAFLAQPAWLRHLLSHGDLPMEAPRRKS